MMLVAMAFASLNLGSMTIHLYFTQFSVPIAAAVFILLLIGALLGVVASGGVWLRQAQANRRLRRRLENCDKELSNLRNIAIKDSS